MKKRVCLLTGASGVLGSAFIQRFAACYSIVAVHHRSEIRFASQHQRFVDPLSPTAPRASNAHAVHAICADLSRADAIDALIRDVIHYGTVDLFIHAAAVRTSSHLLAHDGLDSADASFALNVMAPLRVAAGLGRSVWRTDAAANVRANRNVIIVSSTAGLFVYEDAGQAIHSATQAALNHVTYHLASELWHSGVRVNGIALPLPLDGFHRALPDAIAKLGELDRASTTGHIEIVGAA
jgi:NAD(P)-dependent dehydrogenase (short-subunit alcohol dehydrogenase family)